MFPFFKTACNSEIIETTVLLTFLESGRNRNRTVCFNTGQPKTIINMYLGKRNFLNRSIRLLIGRFCAGSDSQHSDTTHQYQKLVLHII